MRIPVFLFAIFVLIVPGTVIASQEEIHIMVSSGCGGGPRYLGVTEETARQQRIIGVMPTYPPAAIEGNISGVVVLEAVINEQGAVTDLEVIQGNRILTRAARKAVKQWKYHPVVVDGNPVAVESTVVLVFRLTPRPRVTENPKAYSAPLVSCQSADSQIIRRVDPVYPATARIAHVQGDVVTEILIDKDGNVAEAKVTSGHPLLVETTLNAVKQWKFKPSVLNPRRSTVTVRFHM